MVDVLRPEVVPLEHVHERLAGGVCPSQVLTKALECMLGAMSHAHVMEIINII